MNNGHRMGASPASAVAGVTGDLMESKHWGWECMIFGLVVCIRRYS
jgi:hypothetical protein